jgi:hypothetical protein
MGVESMLGLFVEGLYPEEDWAIAAFRGNDLVTLLLVTPLLAIALVIARRSERWALVWYSGLLYGVYNFAYYVFGSRFNDVFLLHVATLALSITALIALSSSLDAEALAARFADGRMRRVVAGFMIFVGAALIAAWGSLSLRFAINSTLPENLMPPEAVHLVYAIDLGLLAPMFLAGGILLWRRAPWGWALGVAVNLFGFAYLTVLEVVGGFQAEEGLGEATWLSAPVIGGAVLCGLAALTVMRMIRVE